MFLLLLMSIFFFEVRSLFVSFTLLCDDYCEKFYAGDSLRLTVPRVLAERCTYHAYEGFEANPGDVIKIQLYNDQGDIGYGGFVNIEGFTIKTKDGGFWTGFSGETQLGSYPYNGVNYPFFGKTKQSVGEHNIYFSIPQDMKTLSGTGQYSGKQFLCKPKTFYTSSRRNIEINLFELIEGQNNYKDRECPYDVKIQIKDGENFKGSFKTKDQVMEAQNEEGLLVSNNEILTYIPDPESFEEYSVTFTFLVYKWGFLEDCESSEVTIKVCAVNCKCECSEDPTITFCEDPSLKYFHGGECVSEEAKPENYYISEEEGIFKPCHENCKTCKKGENEGGQQCDKCVESLYFLENDENQGNCYNEPPSENYVIEGEFFYKCYETCRRCFARGSEEEHHCQICQLQLEYTTGNEMGNCLNASEVESNLEEVQQFLPIKKPLADENDIKILPISNNHTLYYYTTSTNVNEKKVPYVNINDCKDELIKKNGLSEDEELFIGLLVEDGKTSGTQFNVYDKKGNLLDVTQCQSKIEKIYPINKDLNKGSLVNSFFTDYSLKEKIKDLYDVDSDIYTDPCYDMKVNGESLFLSERQEMYLKELQLCPKNCDYSSVDKILKTVSCACTPSTTEEPISLKDFEFSIVNRRFFGLFPCHPLFSAFPEKRSYLHWMPLSFVGFNLVSFVLFIKNFPAIAQKVLPGPENKKRKRMEKSIELGNIEDQSRRYSRNSSARLTKVSKDNKKSSSNLTEDNCTDNSYSEIKDEGFCDFFKETMGNKTLILSICCNNNPYYVVYMRIMLNIAAVSLLIFFNSLLYQGPADPSGEKPFNIVFALCSCLLSFAFYKVGYVVFSNYCKTKVKVLVKGIVELVLVLGFCFCTWYYLYLFGVVFHTSQVPVLLLSAISFGFFILIQLFSSLIIAGIKAKAKSSSQQTLLKLSNILDLIF